MSAAPWCGRPLADDRDGWYARAMAFKESAEEAEREIEHLKGELEQVADALDTAESESARLRAALDKAAGQLGYLSTVLSHSNKPSNAKGALEWSEAARAAASRPAGPAHG